MASEQHVRHYLAYWLQLGKPLIINHGQARLHPHNVLSGSTYSQEFEQGWEMALRYASTSYLEGVHPTIAELLSPVWEIVICSRCPMPVPMQVAGIPHHQCPCQDMESVWPNSDTLPPRSPVASQDVLLNICDNLKQWKGDTRPPRKTSERPSGSAIG